MLVKVLGVAMKSLIQVWLLQVLLMPLAWSEPEFYPVCQRSPQIVKLLLAAYGETHCHNINTDLILKESAIDLSIVGTDIVRLKTADLTGLKLNKLVIENNPDLEVIESRAIAFSVVGEKLVIRNNSKLERISTEAFHSIYGAPVFEISHNQNLVVIESDSFSSLFQELFPEEARTLYSSNYIEAKPPVAELRGKGEHKEVNVVQKEKPQYHWWKQLVLNNAHLFFAEDGVVPGGIVISSNKTLQSLSRIFSHMGPIGLIEISQNDDLRGLSFGDDHELWIDNIAISENKGRFQLRFFGPSPLIVRFSVAVNGNPGLTGVNLGEGISCSFCRFSIRSNPSLKEITPLLDEESQFLELVIADNENIEFISPGSLGPFANNQGPLTLVNSPLIEEFRGDEVKGAWPQYVNLGLGRHIRLPKGFLDSLKDFDGEPVQLGFSDEFLKHPVFKKPLSFEKLRLFPVQFPFPKGLFRDLGVTHVSELILSDINIDHIPPESFTPEHLGLSAPLEVLDLSGNPLSRVEEGAFYKVKSVRY